MSARPVVVIGVLVMICFWFPQTVSASRSLSIISDKNTLLGEEECHITASASGFTDGDTIYIKGAFFQNGSSNYFGYTKDGETWIKNSASNVTQRAVTIGSWDGTLTVKSDFGDSGYKGEGDYSFKVGFYYGSGSVIWSANILSMTINEPDPTSTLTPTPTNTPTPTLTPTSKPEQTNTNTPTSTRTPTPSAAAKPSPSMTEIPTDDIQNTQPMTDEGTVLGESTHAAIVSSAWSEFQPKILALIISAMVLAAAAILLSVRNMIHADNT